MTPIEPFVDPLPIPSVLAPNAIGADGTRHYRMTMRLGLARVHQALPTMTPVWGYDGLYPGPTIEMPWDKKVVVEFLNDLQGDWPFFVPPEAHGGHAAHAGHTGHVFKPDRPWTVIHLHGSPTVPGSDGWSDDAFFPGQQMTYHYPPQERAALFWYHDHANMITRLNVYAGLAGLYIVRDDTEPALGLPVGPPYEIPLLLQDRDLEEQAGSFTGRFQYRKLSDISTFTGNYHLVNGVIWPYHPVEPRQYRLRILNGANGRFYRLRFLVGDDADPIQPEELLQIGADGGFLPTPVPIHSQPGLVLAPAERADVILDLRPYAGKKVTVVDAPPPRNIMEFRVGPQAGGSSAIVLPKALPTMPPVPQTGQPRVRKIVLIPGGEHAPHSINGRRFHDEVDETPELGAVEIWEFINTAQEDHPMHVHQVQFEVLDRRPFTVPWQGEPPLEFTKQVMTWLKDGPPPNMPLPPGLAFAGAAQPPDANEVRPKDTVRAFSLHVTRIIARFGPYTGRYMYHCHILEHEDMEMMRPFVVVPRGFPVMAAHGQEHQHHA